MSEASEHEVVRIARTIRYDLTALQAKTSELLLALGRLSLEDQALRLPCPECGLRLVGEHRIAEHRYVVHDVPLPEGHE